MPGLRQECLQWPLSSTQQLAGQNNSGRRPPLPRKGVVEPGRGVGTWRHSRGCERGPRDPGRQGRPKAPQHVVLLFYMKSRGSHMSFPSIRLPLDFVSAADSRKGSSFSYNVSDTRKKVKRGGDHEPPSPGRLHPHPGRSPASPGGEERKPHGKKTFSGRKRPSR